MLPVLLRLGPVTVYTYGVFLLLALVISLFVIWRRGRELYFDEEDLFDALFSILLVMLLTSRLGYLVKMNATFGLNVFAWVNVIGRPGFVYETGLVGGLVEMWRQAKIRKWDVYSLGDVLMTGLALAMATVSLGAFLNGSGYGLPTTSVVGVTFPGLFEKRIPVQLFEWVLYGLLFGFLWRLESVYRTLSWYRGSKSEAHSGFIMAVFLVLHGLIGIFGAELRLASEWRGIRVDILYYLAIFVGGLLLLENRSGIQVFDSVLTKAQVVKSRMRSKTPKTRRKSKTKDSVRDLGEGIIN